MMSATAANVAIDTTFGAGGYVSLDAPAGQSIVSVEAASILPAPDGSVYVEASLHNDLGFGAAYPNGQIGIAHVLADGSVDRAFGTGGWAVVRSGTDYSMGGAKLKLLGDGKLLIFDGGDNVGFGDPVSVTRLNGDGSPDATFGVGGTATFDDPPVSGGMWGIEYQQAWVDAAGRINLFGLTPSGEADGEFQAAWLRLNADGTPDTTWSPSGVVESAPAPGTRPPTAGEWLPGSIVLDAKPLPAGGVVAYVESDYEMGTMTYEIGADTAVNQIVVDARGAISSYRQVVDITAGNVPYAVGQADGGAWVIAGMGRLTHVTPDGGVDVDVDASDAGADFWPTTLAVQPDGKVLVMGMSAGMTESGVRRFNADGSVDTTFAGGLPAAGLGGPSWATGAELPGGAVVLGVAWANEDATLHLVKLMPEGGVLGDDSTPAPEGTAAPTSDDDAMTLPAAFVGAGESNWGTDAGNGLFADVAGSSVWNPDGIQDVFA